MGEKEGFPELACFVTSGKLSALSGLPFKVRDPTAFGRLEDRAHDCLEPVNLGVLGSWEPKERFHLPSLPGPLPGEASQTPVPFLMNRDTTNALRNGSWAETEH